MQLISRGKALASDPGLLQLVIVEEVRLPELRAPVFDAVHSQDRLVVFVVYLEHAGGCGYAHSVFDCLDQFDALLIRNSGVSPSESVAVREVQTLSLMDACLRGESIAVLHAVNFLK